MAYLVLPVVSQCVCDEEGAGEEKCHPVPGREESSEHEEYGRWQEQSVQKGQGWRVPLAQSEDRRGMIHILKRHTSNGIPPTHLNYEG